MRAFLLAALFFVFVPVRGAQATNFTQTTYADFTGSSATWVGWGSSVTSSGVQLGYRAAETLGVVTSTNLMPQGLYKHAMAVWNGRLYVTGGQNSLGQAQSTVYSAPINPDGSLGTWTTQNNFPARADHAMSAWNGRLYVTGGYNGGTTYSAVYSAPINSDGAWEPGLRKLILFRRRCIFTPWRFGTARFL